MKSVTTVFLCTTLYGCTSLPIQAFPPTDPTIIVISSDPANKKDGDRIGRIDGESCRRTIFEDPSPDEAIAALVTKASGLGATHIRSFRFVGKGVTRSCLHSLVARGIAFRHPDVE